MTLLRAGVSAIAGQSRVSDQDCCVFHRAVLRHRFGADLVDQVPIGLWHLIVEDGAGPWSPVEAVVQARLGEIVSAPVPGRWHSIQGWRGTPLGSGVTGHTLFWRALTVEWGFSFDSARSRGQRLTGLRRWSEIPAEFHGGVAVAALVRAA